jgi:hypothetical protein
VSASVSVAVPSSKICPPAVKKAAKMACGDARISCDTWPGIVRYSQPATKIASTKSGSTILRALTQVHASAEGTEVGVAAAADMVMG